MTEHLSIKIPKPLSDALSAYIEDHPGKTRSEALRDALAFFLVAVGKLRSVEQARVHMGAAAYLAEREERDRVEYVAKLRENMRRAREKIAKKRADDKRAREERFLAECSSLDALAKRLLEP